jgi:hypothetical protein
LSLVEKNKKLMIYINDSTKKKEMFARSVSEYKDVNDILLKDIEKTSLDNIISLVNDDEMYNKKKNIYLKPFLETFSETFSENPNEVKTKIEDVKRRIEKLSKNAEDNKRIIAILTKWLQIYTMQNTNATIKNVENTIAEKQISLKQLEEARMSDEDLQKLKEYISLSRNIEMPDTVGFFEDLDLDFKDITNMCFENNEVCLYILRIGENQIDTIYDEAKNNSKNIEDEIKFIMKIFNELFNYAVGIPINEPVLASYFQNFINYFKGGVKYDNNESPNLFKDFKIATNGNTGIVDFMHNITRFFFIDLQGIDKSEKINWKDTIEYPYKLNDFKDSYLQFQINWFDNIYDSETTSDVGVGIPTRTAYTNNLIHIIDFIGIYNQAKFVLGNAIDSSNKKIAKKIIIFMYQYIENNLKQNSAYKMLRDIVDDNNSDNLSTFKKWEYSQMYLKYATIIDGEPENLRIYDVIKNINMSKIMTLVRINNFDHNGNPTNDWNKARFLPYINGNKDRMMLSYNNDNIQYYANDVNLRKDIKDDSDNGLTNENGFTDKFIKKYKHYLFGNFNKIFPSDMKAKDGVSINKTISQDKDTFQRLYNQLYANKIVFVLGYGSSGAGKTSSLIHNKSVKENKDGIMVEFINGMSREYGEIDFTSIEMAGKRTTSNHKETYVMQCLKNGKEIEASDKNYKATFKRNQDDKCFILITEPPPSASNPPSGSKSRSSTSQSNRNKQDSSDKEDIENQKKTIGDVLFERVDKNRKVHSTMNNPNSSRSHVICILKFKKKSEDLSEDLSEDNPILVIGDLAGVENKFDNNNAGIVHRFVNQFELKKSIEGGWRKEGNEITDKHIEGFYKHYTNNKLNDINKINFKGNKDEIIEFFVEKLVKVKHCVKKHPTVNTNHDNYFDTFTIDDDDIYREGFKTLIESMITTENNIHTLKKFTKTLKNSPNTEHVGKDYDMFDETYTYFNDFKDDLINFINITVESQTIALRATPLQNISKRNKQRPIMREELVKIAKHFGYKSVGYAKKEYESVLSLKRLGYKHIEIDQNQVKANLFTTNASKIIPYLIDVMYSKIPFNKKNSEDAPKKPIVTVESSADIFSIEDNDTTIKCFGKFIDKSFQKSGILMEKLTSFITKINSVLDRHHESITDYLTKNSLPTTFESQINFNTTLIYRISLLQAAWIYSQHGKSINKIFSYGNDKKDDIEKKVEEKLGGEGLTLFKCARKIPLWYISRSESVLYDIMLFFAAGVGEKYKEKMYFIKEKYRKTKLLSNAEIYADVTQLRNNVNDYIDHVLWVQSVIPNRTAEGMYINDDLRDLREDILNCMIEKTKGYIFTSPLYHDVCKSSFCNTETKKCFAMKSEISENKNKLENTSAKSFIMGNLFKNIYGDPPTALLTDFYNKLQITIFTVFNIRKGANNPPPQVYLDINDLNMSYHSNEVIDTGTLDDIVNRLKPIIDQIKTNPNLQLLNDPLRIYNENIIKDKSNAIFNFLKEIDNHNAISTMGTLFFTDNMSKYGTTQNVCTILDKDIKASSYTINDFNIDLSFPKEVIEIGKEGKDEKFDIVHKGDTQTGVPRVKQDGELSNSLKATIENKQQQQQQQHILPEIHNQAVLIKNVRELTIENESFDNIETQPKMINNLETKRVALKNILIKLNNKMFDEYIYNKHEYLDIKDDEKDAEKIKENIKTIKKNIEMNNNIVKFILKYVSEQNRPEFLNNKGKNDNNTVVVDKITLDELGNQQAGPLKSP